MDQANPIPATPAKLRDGSWGARVQGAATPGDLLKIETRAGKSWDAYVARVIWQGEGVSLVATRSADRPMRRQRSARSGWCNCGACDDLLSFGYAPGAVITCPECGKKAEAC